MNDLYVGGALCSFHNQFKYRLPLALKLSAILSGGRLFSFSLINILFCVCLAQARQQVDGTSAAIGLADSIKPLQIGDTIPESLWNLPLQIIKAGQEGSTTVKLKDYKGKLIILELWSTYCASCIANMPRLHHLAAQFPDEVMLLPTTDQQAELIGTFLKRSKSPVISQMGNTFYSLVEQGFRDFFSYQTIPHSILINGSGRVLAYTTPDQISAQLLSRLLKNKEENVQIATKVDSHLKEPLLTLRQSEGFTHGPLFYSMVSGYTDGFVAVDQLERDTANATLHLYATCLPVVNLYQKALLGSGRPSTALMPKRRILEVDHPEQWCAHAKRPDDSLNEETIAWHRNHYRNYEAVLPISYSNKEVFQYMLNDLDRFLGLKGRMEKRTVPVMVLGLAQQGKLPFATKGGAQVNIEQGYTKEEFPKYVGPSETGALNYKRNFPMKSLLYLLNSAALPFLPPVVDETGVSGNVDIDLPDDLQNTEELRDCLLKQGLKLEEAQRELDMFVLSQTQGYNPGTTLHLTPYGFTY